MIILKNISTEIGSVKKSKDKLEIENKILVNDISILIKNLFAEKKQSVLIILQGMDASGKDGLVKNLFSGVPPEMVQVHSFKKPTEMEMQYDYLRRVHDVVPPKGKIGVFNRSHYEDILVPSVYKYLDKKTIQQRYEQINNFEKYLSENGTTIIKIYLHLSYEKQEQKLRERIDDPEKHWKHNDGDWETRLHWEEFMKVYEKIFTLCNDIPWQVVPSDKNSVKLNEAAIILKAQLIKLNPQFPPLESEKFTPIYEKAKEVKRTL